jgi:predicted RNA-binding protein
MAYWLDLFTPHTWTRFQDHGASISGFRPRQRNTAFERVKPGHLFLCYLVKLSRWCGVLEVTSSAFEDQTPIFADETIHSRYASR